MDVENLIEIADDEVVTKKKPVARKKKEQLFPVTLLKNCRLAGKFEIVDYPKNPDGTLNKEVEGKRRPPTGTEILKTFAGNDVWMETKAAIALVERGNAERNDPIR